jgi:predicted porin
MKKSLIALAVLAAAGAASAQSSVTVYGKVDLGLNQAIGSDINKLGEASGSRFGFTGAEDLGGGLKANFKLEHRFQPDTGAVTKPDVFWHGTSTVGLSGGFGSVDLGRTYSAAFYTASAGDVFGWDGVASNAATTGAGTQAARFANGIFYTSPSFNGFTARASYALKENGDNYNSGTKEVGAATKNGTSVELAYATGPVRVSVAAERNVNENEYVGVGASYNFGVAKANLLIAKGEKANGDENDAVVLGLVVPMGALTLKASYAQLEVNNVDTIKQLGLGARYALSKRTDLYTSVANNSKAASDKTGYEFGIQHNF